MPALCWLLGRRILVLVGWPGRESLDHYQDVTMPSVSIANTSVSPWHNVNSVWNALCSLTCGLCQPDTSNVADPEAWVGLLFLLNKCALVLGWQWSGTVLWELGGFHSHKTLGISW